MWDGRKLIECRIEVTNHWEWGALSVSGELCGECLPELVPALLLPLVVWGVDRQNAEWRLDGVDGEAKKSAIDAGEICAGGCGRGAVIRDTPPVKVCMGWPLLSYSSVALWVMV